MDKLRKIILMVVYNQIQSDARVIRAAEAIDSLNRNVVIISCNSSINYNNPKFKSVVFSSKQKGPALLFSFWFYVFKYALMKKKEIELFYMHDYDLAFCGWIIASLFKIKWVYDAHELLLKRKNEKCALRDYFFILLESISIKKADLVIAANDERKRIIKYIYKLSNVISVRNIAPRSINIGNELKDDFIVYQGYMSEERKVSYFIRLLKFLPSNIKLKLIGTGPNLERYKELVHALSLAGRVIFTGMIPYSELLAESKRCKVGITFYDSKGLNNYYCSPNKIYEYSQLGIPILVSPQPFLKRIVSKYHIGEVLETEATIEENASLILKIFNNHLSYKPGMTKFLADFSYEDEMDKLKVAISKILL